MMGPSSHLSQPHYMAPPHLSDHMVSREGKQKFSRLVCLVQHIIKLTFSTDLLVMYHGNFTY